MSSRLAGLPIVLATTIGNWWKLSVLYVLNLKVSSQQLTQVNFASQNLTMELYILSMNIPTIINANCSYMLLKGSIYCDFVIWTDVDLNSC